MTLLMKLKEEFDNSRYSVMKATVINALSKNRSVEEIVDITGYPKDFVLQVKDEQNFIEGPE